MKRPRELVLTALPHLPVRVPAVPWRHRTSAETVLFHRVRLRLTLWYSGVLAAALLVFGLALYGVMQRTLLQPIDTDLHTAAQTAAVPWGDILIPCAHVDPRSLTACYDPQGHLLATTALVQEVVPGFVDTQLAQEAAQNGSAIDTVDTHTTLKQIRVYAVRVADDQGNFLGVVQVGEPVGGQLDALHVLRTLLVIFGIIALLLASLGGIFLAGRALNPIRRAYSRQREFIADASHELRTPLTILRADAEVLLRGRARFDPDDAAILEDVVAETAHMTGLANSMLSLARLEGGDRHLEQDVVDLAALAVDTARRIGTLAAEKGVRVRVDAPEAVIVLGDRQLLEQAIVVLADNAVKYNHPDGEVVLQARQEGDQAVVRVRDTGIGIAPEHLPRLGERFYRVDKARSREAGGTGLGLSIARNVAEMHRGTLRFESMPEEGTVAVLSLPAARERQPAALPAG